MIIYFRIKHVTPSLSLDDQITYFEEYLRDFNRMKNKGLKADGYILHEPEFSRNNNPQFVAKYIVNSNADFSLIQSNIENNDLHSYFLIFVDLD